MCNWAGEIDMPHTLTAHLGQGDLNATLFADNTTMFEALVLATQTFIVLVRAKILAQKRPSRSGLNVR